MAGTGKILALLFVRPFCRRGIQTSSLAFCWVFLTCHNVRCIISCGRSPANVRFVAFSVPIPSVAYDVHLQIFFSLFLPHLYECSTSPPNVRLRGRRQVCRTTPQYLTVSLERDRRTDPTLARCGRAGANLPNSPGYFKLTMYGYVSICTVTTRRGGKGRRQKGRAARHLPAYSPITASCERRDQRACRRR